MAPIYLQSVYPSIRLSIHICNIDQGSLHYTPEHCLVNGGFLYFGGKSHVSNGQNVSFKKPCRYIHIRRVRTSVCTASGKALLEHWSCWACRLLYSQWTSATSAFSKREFVFFIQTLVLLGVSTTLIYGPQRHLHLVSAKHVFFAQALEMFGVSTSLVNHSGPSHVGLEMHNFAIRSVNNFDVIE